MKLTIVADDNLVIVDGVGAKVDLTVIGIPSNLHALQWDNSAGHLEYKDVANEDIIALPSWASDCVTAHVAAIAEIEANRPEEFPDLTPAELVREERDQKLAETDWWALSDNTMTVEQASYRQALRDITDQAGFPHSVTWPTKP